MKEEYLDRLSPCLRKRLNVVMTLDRSAAI